jgi:glutamate carboxypeptidase
MTEGMLVHLEELVKCESPTSDLEACRRVVKKAIEISNQVVGVGARALEEEGRPIFWLGSESPKVVLLGHLDTVWPLGSFEPLWKIENGIARGPGIYDMKAGFIQALYAIKRLDLSSVALIATTDEETGSINSRKLIERVSKGALAVLVLESAIDGKVKIGRKGTSMYTVQIEGKAAHAGLEPEKGINATVEIAHIVLALTQLENSKFGTSVVPTVVKAGTTTNTVPSLATLEIDSRSYSLQEMERVREAIFSLTTKNPEAKIRVLGGINRPPLEEVSTHSLYEVFEGVVEKMGNEPIGAEVVGGASDGNFAGIYTRVLDGLGAVGSGAHALSENISIKDLEPRTLLLTEFVKELLK